MKCKECGFRLWALRSQALGVCAGCRDESDDNMDVSPELEERLAASLDDEQINEVLP